MKVIVIPADALKPIREEEAPSDNDSPGFAQWANATVGGYLEMLRPRSFPTTGLIFWMNEDAKSLGLPTNLRATRLSLLAPFDYIAGEVVVTGSKGPETAACPLPLADFQAMTNAVMFGASAP